MHYAPLSQYVLILVSLLMLPQGARAQEKLTLSASNGNYVSLISKYIVRQAYAEMGIEVEFAHYPKLRSLQYSNVGLLDGELMRIDGISKEYPNLIKVPVSIILIEGVAFTIDQSIPVTDFNSLSPYRIAFKTGIKFAEYATQGMATIDVDSVERAFLLLRANRVDVVVTSKVEGLRVIAETGVIDIEIHPISAAKYPLYHYLNKTHAELVPELARHLQALHDKGVAQDIRDLMIEELTSAANNQQY